MVSDTIFPESVSDIVFRFARIRHFCVSLSPEFVGAGPDSDRNLSMGRRALRRSWQ